MALHIMTNNDNKQLILKYERTFTAKLASAVLDKPKLSSWMIFIPFIFIFYIQDLMKYKKGRKEFMEHYLLSHEKALNEAYQAILESRKPDADILAKHADLTGKAMDMYADLLNVLSEHYTCLLKGNGDTYANLIKSAYGKNKTNLLLFFNRLDQAEKKLNKALSPKLKKSQPGVIDIIKKMEKSSDTQRRADIHDIYGA
jgi:hypothetical protein